ncbi:uncharacterized protein CIMG_12867 [Coccidioides immitis RS]|uniref:Uncharacterized protein n=1 Tax=Coccidioides immitis (strain RS) TaxID=246410 RepID=J3KH57_COCIM|nr:uncharacterized protein CIMG_12867 [Coccidioides immitis RS]EAS35157.3 hypothetical protein CIMG_12867 [Coccidioides immitis RS]
MQHILQDKGWRRRRGQTCKLNTGYLVIGMENGERKMVFPAGLSKANLPDTIECYLAFKQASKSGKGIFLRGCRAPQNDAPNIR